MILIMFLIVVIFGSIFFYVGITQESFPASYLAMFVFLILGLFLLSEGLSIPNGTVTTGTLPNITQTDTYLVLTASNNAFVALFGYFFFYGAFGATLLTTYFAINGGSRNEFEYDWD